jgi:acyl carrier protein
VSFLDSGIIDSTSVLELTAFLEETFQIRIQDDELLPTNLDSLAAVEAFVKRKTGK